MNAFLTGSQVYGTPTDKSDIDLVVLLSDDDRELLADIVAQGYELPDTDYNQYGLGSLNLRFGKLNLIVAKDEKEYHRWKRGTNALILEAPVTRETAVATFKALKAGGL